MYFVSKGESIVSLTEYSPWQPQTSTQTQCVLRCLPLSEMVRYLKYLPT